MNNDKELARKYRAAQEKNKARQAKYRKGLAGKGYKMISVRVKLETEKPSKSFVKNWEREEMTDEKLDAVLFALKWAVDYLDQEKRKNFEIAARLLAVEL